MYLIQNKNGSYVKTGINGIVLTSNESLADSFQSRRTATDFITKNFNKKQRKYYTTVYISGMTDPLERSEKDTSVSIVKTDDTKKNHGKQIQDFVEQELALDIEKYKEEMNKYDGIILDLRHYIRNENTKLNASWGYKIAKSLQIVERKRVECKKEYQRLVALREGILKAIEDSQTFEYEPYKNRVIEDVFEFVNTTVAANDVKQILDVK